MFHFLKLRKMKTKFELAMKIDMNKAYDRIEWDFFEAFMIRMSFSGRWIKVVIGMCLHCGLLNSSEWTTREKV